MNTTEPGVVSATIEVNLDLPPSPEGLLSLSLAFDRVGYVKLARYLRACGDTLSGKPPRISLRCAPGDPDEARP